MKKFLLMISFITLTFANDVVLKESCVDVSTTLNNLRNIVESKGLSVFAVINHSANAKMVDMKLNESKMIIFGNPKLGTALMQQDMQVGLDLPLRILVYRDSDGKVKMAYRDASWLESKHILNAPKKIAKVDKAMAMFVRKAGQCLKD
jgi:uncharacterized protein (DUF302 family)